MVSKFLKLDGFDKNLFYELLWPWPINFFKDTEIIYDRTIKESSPETINYMIITASIIQLQDLPRYLKHSKKI